MATATSTKYLYLKQCPGTDAEPGLADGAWGPAQFSDANGALVWEAPTGGALVSTLSSPCRGRPPRPRSRFTSRPSR